MSNLIATDIKVYSVCNEHWKYRSPILLEPLGYHIAWTLEQRCFKSLQCVQDSSISGYAQPEATGAVWASPCPWSPAPPTSRPALLCSTECTSPAADPSHENICILACTMVPKVFSNLINSKQGNTVTDGVSLSECLQKRREAEMRGGQKQGIALFAKDRAPSSVAGGLEETHRTLKTPMLEGSLAWVEWTQAFSSRQCSPWAQRPIMVSP